MRVGGDPSALGQFHAGLVEIQSRGERLAPDRDEDQVGLVGNRARGVAAGELDPLVGDFGRFDLRAELELHAQLLEIALQNFRRLGIEADRGDAGQKFDHRNLRAQPAPDGAELQADRARADHEHRLGHFGQRNALVAVDHALAVILQEGKLDRHAAGGQHDVLGLQRPLRAAVVGYLDRVRIDQLAEAAHDLDLVLLHQVADAGRELAHHVEFALHHRAEIDLDILGDDAVRREAFAGEMQVFRRGQERLARDAADVEAGAAERLVLFDNDDLETKLRGADGGDITTGTAADDDQLIIKIGHGNTLA